ncbi:MAG: coproporphyrinogen dehydrogenase HemZ [Clostridia bacterium]|nr:coproporphyrinogen dehydrogenase HemZ [Clostridia bacterium]
MKVIINGDISSFYVETLCLLFYPGSKFSDKESDGYTVTVNVDDEPSGVRASVSINNSYDTYSEDFFLESCKNLSRPSMAKKIAVGKAFLEAGKKALGIVPPWGILTGVRPSKLALWELEKGKSVDETVGMFVNEYAVSEEKAKLACEIASCERSLLKQSLYGKSSVYISIPFCPSKCSYCSFVSFTSEKLLSLIPEYLDTLVCEIVRTGKLINRLGQKVSTVYIGGGTPSILSETQLEKLLKCVSDSIDISSLDEFSLEAGRPDTITAEKFRIAKDYGVSRVSVNTQTLNDDVLRSIGRRHDSYDFFRAYDLAERSGIKDVNVDLIAGLPGESSESFASSVDRITDLSPENITVHTFCVKRSADLRFAGVYAAECKTAEKSVSYSEKSLISRGYSPYYMYRQKNAVGNLENVGYSVPGHECLYNVLMMEEIQSIFAVGAGAVTKLVAKDHATDGQKIVRIAENKYPYEYLREKRDPDNTKNLIREKEIIEFFDPGQNTERR